MSTKKETTPPPQQTTPLSGRANVGQLFHHYHADKDTEDLISDCYFDKRPKPYPMVYRRIYDLSRNSKFGFHIVSWCIAISFVQSLVPLLVDAASLPTIHPLQNWILAGAALAYLEYSQHQTLETLWTVYFQYKKIVPGIAILTTLFSIISIVTSVYAAFALLSNSGYQIGFVCFALFVETMIITNSYNIHNYRKKTANSVKMENDFNRGLDPGMYFHNQPQSVLTPMNYNQAIQTPTKIEIEEGAKMPITKIVTPSKFEIQKFSLSNSESKPLRTTKRTQISKEKDLIRNTQDKSKTTVLTATLDNSRERWTKNQVQSFLKSYEAKIRKEGKTFTKVAHKTFFADYLKRWQEVSTNGTAPKIDPIERKKWYEEKYPEISEKLKQVDKKKRDRK